jgi:hypothetical protein
MSGTNTKANKIDRILSRQAESNEDIENIYALIRLGHETDQATIKMLTATAHRLEAENATLRKYLGSILFQRRKVESIPTLEPQCSCATGVCKNRPGCRHRIYPTLEPKWGGLPPDSKGTPERTCQHGRTVGNGWHCTDCVCDPNKTKETI